MARNIRPRPTTYAGIKMRSRLEADYAQWLDQHGVKWEYEPTCFAGPAGQWLPDFKDVDGRTTEYTEVKPREVYDERTHDDAWVALSEIMRRMEVAWLSEPDALLSLVLWEYRGKGFTVFRAWLDTGWEVSLTPVLSVPVKLADV